MKTWDRIKCTYIHTYLPTTYLCEFFFHKKQLLRWHFPYEYDDLEKETSENVEDSDSESHCGKNNAHSGVFAFSGL